MTISPGESKWTKLTMKVYTTEFLKIFYAVATAKSVYGHGPLICTHLRQTIDMIVYA